MKQLTVRSLSSLYRKDETAWLETMSQLLAERRIRELDYRHLSEYLADMAKRYRREVMSRLTTLLAHLLKWDHQPEKQTRSWRATIAVQRHELEDLLESATLKKHARDILAKAYARAVRQASLETGLNESAFPAECPYSLDDVLTDD